MDRQEFRRAYGKIVERAWSDEEFKQRLLSDSTTVLKEYGLTVPNGVKFKVVESTRNVMYLILPPKPDFSEVTSEALEARQAAAIVGGSAYFP